MSTDPTAERIDAVARALSTPDWGEWSSAYHPDHNKWTFDGSHRTDGEREMYRNAAAAILTSTDPAVHAALAASLPAEVMLAALEAHYSLVRLPAQDSDRPGWRRYLLTWEAQP